MEIENENIEEEVNNRINNRKTAFLEELKASIKVIFSEPISIIFYFVLFIVLFSLEFFVVSQKVFKKGEEKDLCDYEQIVLHQLASRRLLLENSKRSLHEKYVTKSIEGEPYTDSKIHLSSLPRDME